MDTLTTADLATAPTEPMPTVQVFVDGEWVDLPKEFKVVRTVLRDGSSVFSVRNRYDTGDYQGNVTFQMLLNPKSYKPFGKRTTLYVAKVSAEEHFEWTWRGEDDLDVWVVAKPHYRSSGPKVDWLASVKVAPDSVSYGAICEAIREQHPQPEEDIQCERSFAELGHGTHGRTP